jgi:hypothetical protein
MTTHSKSVLLAVALFLCAWCLPAGATRSWEEISRATSAAQGNISQAQATIAKAEQAVQEALGKVQSANHFEGPQWIELQKAMTDYTKTFQQQVKIIDGNVKNLLKVYPAADIPTLDFAPPQFKPAIKAMEAVRDELKLAVKKAKRFKGDRLQDHVKVTLEMEKRTDQQISEMTTDIALNLAGVPLSNDGSIDYGGIIAGLLPGPAGLVNTGLGFAFGLYYYVDEMKSGAMQIKTFEDQIAYADRAITANEANVLSAEQGLQFLNSYWAQKEEVMKEFYAVRNAWTSSASQSRQELKKEETAEFQKELDQPHFAAVNSGFEPPILSNEVEPEAKAVIKELQSAALAAMQGGDPDNFFNLLASNFRTYHGKVDAAQAVVKQAQDKLNQSAVVLNQALTAASAAYYAALRGHCNCEIAYLNAIGNTYNAASAAAWSAHRPFMAALRAAERESTRLSMVISMIIGGADSLAWQIRDFGAAANAAVNREFYQSRNTFEEVAADLSAMNSVLPDPYAIDSINAYINGLDARIRSEVSWGSDPASLRGELRAFAESVRTLGERAKLAIPDYRRTALIVQQSAKELSNGLNASLDKDAMLIASIWDGSLYNTQPSWWSEPSPRGSDRRKDAIAAFKHNLDEAFKLYERDDLDKIAGFNYEGAARQIEEKADSLDAAANSIASFNFRLLGATARLGKVSQALTHQALFTGRAKTPQVLAAQELISGEWAGLVGELDGVQAQATAMREIAAKYMPLTVIRPGVRARLMMAQSVLYTVAQIQMRNYISARNNRYFQPVLPDDFKALETQWTLLKPLYSKFDALAATERAPLLAAQKDFPDSAALLKAYQAIPPGNRRLVDDTYRRYNAEAVYLNDYMIAILEALEPVGDTARNNVLAQLDDWIGAYPEAKRLWERQQAEAQALYERQMAEQRKLAQAQEQARLEREAAEQQKAKAGLESIRKFYQDFATTYQARNLRGLLRYMTSDWKAADGSDLRDLEDILDNSFRVFDRIVFAVTGLGIQAGDGGRYSVSYSVTITGHINQMNLNHQETAQVEDTVILTPDGPKIQATRGGRIWLKQ